MKLAAHLHENSGVPVPTLSTQVPPFLHGAAPPQPSTSVPQSPPAHPGGQVHFGGEPGEVAEQVPPFLHGGVAPLQLSNVPQSAPL